MRFFQRRKAIGAVAAGTLFGGGAVYYATWRNHADAATVPSLTAAEFNAIQDQAKLAAALRPVHLPWTYHQLIKKAPNIDPFEGRVAAEAESTQKRKVKQSADLKNTDFVLHFYRLLGCPFCAKVEWVLRYYDVPYKETLIDPVNGSGLPDARYQLAPQLLFSPIRDAHPDTSTSKHDGVYLVDSSSIVEALAVPLGYTKDLKDTRITATREWITTRFQGVSFVIANSSLRSAYQAYNYLTPPHYHTLVYHLLGSFALYALANLKIRPGALANVHPLSAAYDAGLKDKGEAHSAKLTPEEWLRHELSVFLAQRHSGKEPFHGGSTPDLADIEMYAVTRVMAMHPRFAPVIREGPFGGWQAAMESTMEARNRRT